METSSVSELYEVSTYCCLACNPSYSSHLVDNNICPQLQQTSTTRSLAHAYEKNAHEINAIIAEEHARRLRLRVFMLEDENDDLHDQLSQEDERAELIEKEVEELQHRLEESEEDCQRTQANLRVQTRDMDTLRVRSNMAGGADLAG